MPTKRIIISAYAFYPEFGGLEQQIYLLAQEFLRLGHSVTVLTEKSSRDDATEEEIDGINVVRLPYSKTRTCWAYVRLIVCLIVYLVQNKRSFDVAYLRSALTLYPLVFGFLKFFRLITYPVSVTADTGGEHDEIIIVKRWPFYKILLFFFKRLDAFNSICQANYDHYLELGFDKSRLTRIVNGIETEPFDNSEYPTNVTNFLYIGRFIVEKGLLELVEAFRIIHKLCPTAKLYLAGDGPLKEALLKKVSDYNLGNNIIYKGKVSGKDKEDFYNLGECVVLPSYSEGLPVSILEAAARKKVLLTTDVSDLKILFRSQIIYFEKADIVDLVRAMLLALITNFQNKLNYEAIIKTVTIKKVAKQYLSLFE